MEQTIQLTPLEEQVLIAVGNMAGSLGDAVGIEISGRQRCGYANNWAGTPRERTKLPWPTYPNLDFALGRLTRKGLVGRETSDCYQCYGYQAGLWKLTDHGKLLLGIE